MVASRYAASIPGVALELFVSLLNVAICTVA